MKRGVTPQRRGDLFANLVNWYNARRGTSSTALHLQRSHTRDNLIFTIKHDIIHGCATPQTSNYAKGVQLTGWERYEVTTPGCSVCHALSRRLVAPDVGPQFKILKHG
jgi:hypothetical protein